MTELTYAALQQIMYQPSDVWLATDRSGDRWLHDQWVMLCVSGNSALGDTADGAYKIVVSGDNRGLQPRTAIPAQDLDLFFEVAERDPAEWIDVAPSEWSVAEERIANGKKSERAMLWVAASTPCLVGESTWLAIRRRWPEAEMKYLPRRNLFRFVDLGVAGETLFAYAAGIRIPEGQENIAQAIADLHSYKLTQLATS